MKTLIDIFLTFQDKDDTAIIYRTGIRRFIYSYNQIYDLSLKAATFLEENNIKKGDRIVIWAPNSPWWVVVFWACVAKGVVVIPIDFIAGKENAKKIITLTSPKIVFQSKYLLDRLDSNQATFLEDLQYIIREKNKTKNIETLNPSDLLELIYTSGTTSEPKGVMLTHENVVSNIVQIDEQFKMNNGLKVLSVLPLSHMFEQTISFLYPLYLAGSIVYIRTLKPSSILDALQEENVNVLVAVPRLLQALRNAVERELEAKGLIKVFNYVSKIAKNGTLKHLFFYPIRKKFGNKFLFFVSGGSSLDIDVARFWHTIGFSVVEGYGLTECSPVLTANSRKNPLFGSVGKPLPGVLIKFDQKEILAKGKNIFGGYWQNEKATKDTFSKDGWFKTGDEGEIDKDGNVYIKGRKKDVIVTSSGLNVYPDDIERILNSTDGVKETCVIGMVNSEGEQIHAVLILDKNFSPDKIIREANKKLDVHQQIHGFDLWKEEEFPKTTTLKIQKFKVKKALEKGISNNESISEDKLINLLVKVSGIQVNDIKDTSFLMKDLNITSIGRLELVNYLEQEYRIDLDDTLINQYTTVKHVRELIQNRAKIKDHTYLPLWQLSFFALSLRKFIDVILHFPVFNAISDLKVIGKENVDTIKQPVLFIANHISYIDASFVLYSLPRKLRYNTAIAAREEFYIKPDADFFGRFWRKLVLWYTTLCWSTFLLPQDRGFRNTFTFMGKLIDRGNNILIYPEGERSKDGKLLPFMPGLGLVVNELQVPVVPIKIEGVDKIFPRGATFPKPGPAKVTIGKPLYFMNESPSKIIEISRKALEEL